MFTHILVGYDGSAGSRAALTAAFRLAREFGANITAVAVQPHLVHYGATVGEVDDEREVEAKQTHRITKEIKTQADEQGVKVNLLTVLGHPAHDLVRVAREQKADLVVVGHTGHSGVWGTFLGSTAEKVSRHAPCSVLVVREGTAEGLAGS